MRHDGGSDRATPSRLRRSRDLLGLRVVPMTAEPCAACNAAPGEPCRPDCIALVSILAGIEDATRVACHACRLATVKAGDALIARALTVEASRLYARVELRASDLARPFRPATPESER